MVISKVDPKVSKIYENNLADEKLKKLGDKLRKELIERMSRGFSKVRLKV